MILYHGTNMNALKSIVVNGIQPRSVTRTRNKWKKGFGSNTNCVYLTSVYGLYYAIIAIRNKMDYGVVIEVDISGIEKNLHADEDIIFYRYGLKPPLPKKIQNEIKREAISTPASDSLDTLGTCAHQGPISPIHLRRCVILTSETIRRLIIEQYDPIVSPINFRICGKRYMSFIQWLFDPDDNPIGYNNRRGIFVFRTIHDAYRALTP